MELESASRYVNNLLTKAGLLRGSSIPFHDPSSEPGTERRILNLVHELVSRRERETEQLETLAMTVRTVRGEDTKKQLTINKLTLKNEDLERQISLLKAQARVTASSLHSAEHSVKSHRDEAARLKTSLQQVRTKCAHDIRQRDLQLTKLKEKFVELSRRGQGAQKPTSSYATASFPFTSASLGVEDDDGTNGALAVARDEAEFLTGKCADLADENDNLLAIIRRALRTLNSLQGLDEEEEEDLEGEERSHRAKFMEVTPTNYDLLHHQIEESLLLLQHLINQPNYVPLDEVTRRDEEIIRLKGEILKIEGEWKKAIALVDHWNKSFKRADVAVVSSDVIDEPSNSDAPPAMEEDSEEPKDQEELDSADEEEEEMVHLVEEANKPPPTPSRKKRQSLSKADMKPISVAKLKRSIRKRGSLTPAEMDSLVHGELE